MEDLATLISFDVEHRNDVTMDAVFQIRLAGQTVTCPIPVPVDAEASLRDMERAARFELADRLRALADTLQAKG